MKTMKISAMLLLFALAIGFTSCKNNESSMEETSTETTMETDTTSIAPVTEDVVGDTTTTGMQEGTGTGGATPTP